MKPIGIRLRQNLGKTNSKTDRYCDIRDDVIYLPVEITCLLWSDQTQKRHKALIQIVCSNTIHCVTNSTTDYLFSLNHVE